MSLFSTLRSERGPDQLVLVRHGESVGNLADASARAQGAELLDLSERDADVELSDAGTRQADAVSSWLARAQESERPTLVLSSPFRRAHHTAKRAVSLLELDILIDERLRERDLGVLDGLTGEGTRARYPDESQRRMKVGKFYYQPPGGESWADVALRVRSLLADVRDFDSARIWVFTHQAVIMAFRYVIEGLSEKEILAIDADANLANASRTTYQRSQGRLRLVAFADTSAVDETLS